MSTTETYQQTLSRRNWLQMSSMAMAAICLPDFVLAENSKLQFYQYHLAKVATVPFKLAENKSIPFDWSVAELTANENPILFNWKKKIKFSSNNNIRFRLTSATDVRELCTIEVSLAISKTVIGKLDVRFAHYMQPFELLIPASLHQKILTEGIAVKMIEGTKPFWFFIQQKNTQNIPDAFLPHILESTTTIEQNAWHKRLLSLSSLSTFGWMEGCVLDGLHMLVEKNIQAKNVLHQHLDKYFSNDTLVYEAYNNERKQGEINTVESILPFAMLAFQNPNHPMLQKAIDFCKSLSNDAGVIADEKGNNRKLKTEECYTISYPLAVLAQKFNRPDLQAMAIANLQVRVKLLATPNFIYQNCKELEKPDFPNWARGVAWYLLGLTKTLALLPNNATTKPLRVALQEAAIMVISHQQKNGLWYCFLHEPETGFETSGSAGIAAALAYGYAQNLLPASCKTAAEQCLQGLQTYFTPDGFLTGTVQVNKGGLALQRNGFRVTSPYTLGFLGILEASLQTKKL